MSDRSELSARALLLGSLLGGLLAAAGMYTGHKTMSVNGGHVPAILLGYALLSLSARRPDARELNIVQTVASSAALMAITSGLIGPVTALVIAGREPPVFATAAWGIAVGVVACLVAWPLRRAFIVRGDLPFPSAVASASVLQGIDTGAAIRVRALATSAAIAAAITFASKLGHWIPERTTIDFAIGGVSASAIYFGIGWSPLLYGVGGLAGLRTGLTMIAGSCAAWLVAAPLLVSSELVATGDWLSLVQWLIWPGVGLMLGGTFAGLVGSLGVLRRGLRDLRGAARDADVTGPAHLAAIVLAAAFVIALGWIAFDVHPLISLFAVVLAAVLSVVAGRAKGEADNTPAGALGGLGQLAVGCVAPGGIAAPLAGGGIVNGVAMHAAATLANWKTGHVVGSSPRAQLHASIAGVVVGAVAATAAAELLRRAYGLGTDALPIPGARSWRATAEIVSHGLSALPAYAPLAAICAFAAGVVLGLAQRRPGARFVPSPAALGLACLVPPYIALTLGVGSIVWWVLGRYAPGWQGERAISIASGAIAGEGVAGLIVAALVVAGVT